MEASSFHNPSCVARQLAGKSSACPALYTYTFGLGIVRPARHGHFEQPVLEIGAYPFPAYALGQVHATPETPVVAFPGIVARVIRFALAFPVDGQDAAGEGDFHVLLFYTSELATYYQVVAPGEDVGGRNPCGRVGPPLVFRAPTLGVLPHPG